MTQKTVLIAEDEAEVRSYLEMTLRYQGYRVKSVRDGTEVLAGIAESNGDLAVVMLDIMMPRQDGIETLREIRKLNANLPVIVFSGVASPTKIVEAIKSGASDFLAKPFTNDQLIRAVKKATHAAADSMLAGTPAPAGPKEEFFCSNVRMQAIRSALHHIAVSDVPVVLRGESGVGKEVLAREIHALSTRAAKPFLKINCAALPQELLESELFGYERGAFTGAIKSTPGKFEAADGGLILLDEIGDMDFKLQAKLLHVLQDNEFQRLGGRETVKVNVRILAATHCDLEKGIEEKRFREDLYYRLNVITIDVPPLRERTDEILPLAEHFLQKHAVPGMRVPALTPALKDALLGHRWPGNIRELENVMRKLLVFGDSDGAAQELRMKVHANTSVAAPAIPHDAIRHFDSVSGVPVLEKVNQARAQAEAEAILAALERTRWNRKRAAAVLNIDYKGLLYKMKKLGISPCEGPANPKPASTHRESSPKVFAAAG
jgi:two-component system, NtrC family, response regulator AtoC